MTGDYSIDEPLPPLDIETVKQIHMDIEVCLGKRMSKEQTCHTLTKERGFHVLAVWVVWAGLEKQNPKFFERYHTAQE